MKDLIEALTILSKYVNPYNPTHCEHDILYICAEPNPVSEEDRARLDELGVHFDGETFYSFRYGSA